MTNSSRSARNDMGATRTKNLVAVLVCASAAALVTGNAVAADAAEQSGADTLQEVVVTGTLIRNAAPVGSTLIDFTQTDLLETGGNSLSESLRYLPQIDNLGVTEGSRTGIGGAGNIVYGNSINLRGISPYATLTLLDGHRVPPGGTTGATVDPDSFPSLMMQRVDIVADGASATYGSDAIAGVVNLILRRNVEGVEVQARYGSANHYEENREGLVAGHSWGSGQITIGLEQSYHSDLNGQNRDFFSSNQTPYGGTDYRSNQCNPGNIVVNGVSYAIPAGGVTPATASSLAAGTTNLCDNAKYQDILPQARHQDVAFTLDQRITDWLSLYGDGTYAKRTFLAKSAAYTGALTVPSSNAYFVAPPGTNPASETVNYSFANDIGPYNLDLGDSVNEQITLGFKADLGAGWQARVDGTVGRDGDWVLSPPRAEVNPALGAALASSNPATALNVFGGANSAAVINPIFGGVFLGPGNSEEQVAEVQADGPIFTLPGGDARLAVGAQWRHDTLLYGLNSGPPGAQLVLRQDLGRHSESGFAELLIPIVGAANAVTGVRKLDLDIAGRYEDYSDFGSTTHPKIGVNWSPAESWLVHASYGTSFRAPLLSELVGPLKGTFVQQYSDPLSPTGTSFGYTLGGGNPTLKPETATTYSFGVDYEPVDNAKISLTYYNINYKNQIQQYLSDLTILQQANQLGSLITRCPSAACSALISQYITGPGALPLFGPPLANPSVYVNGLNENLGGVKTQGFDLSARYTFETSVPGRFTVGLTANEVIQYDVQFTPGGAFYDELNTTLNPLKLRLRGDLGWANGPWSLKLFANFANSYTNTQVTPYHSVDSNLTVDVDANYDVGRQVTVAWAKDLTVTLHVMNVGNSTPPYVNIPIGNNGGGYDPGAASPIGRLISLGLGKKF